jgi:hypothetical protein
MDELWYIHNRVFVPKISYQAMKVMEKFKCILLSKRSLSEKVTHYIIPTMQHSGNGKPMQAEG